MHHTISYSRCSLHKNEQFYIFLSLLFKNQNFQLLQSTFSKGEKKKKTGEEPIQRKNGNWKIDIAGNYKAPIKFNLLVDT